MFPEINNKHKVIVLILVVMLIGFTSYNNFLRERKTIYILSDENSNKALETEDIVPSISMETNRVVVHIEGEVEKPGIYTLSKDARIIDAVEAAGGLKDSADTRKINLAKKAMDEEFIYIPFEGEDEFQSSQLGLNTVASNNSNGLVNINQADKNQLESLPGIGSALADRIIDYRNQMGSFKAIEDIQNVSGIGEKRYNDIKDKISVK